MGCGALEALKLALWQRLSQLEHPRHVIAATCEVVAEQTDVRERCRKSAKCHGALNNASLGGWRALELLDLRLGKHSGDRLAALVPEHVLPQTAGVQEKCKMSWGAEQLAVWASDALEAGDGAALQPLAQLADAHGGVGATDDLALVVSDKTAERVIREAAGRVQKRCNVKGR